MLALAAAVVPHMSLLAQSPSVGRVAGKVLDSQTGQVVVGAVLEVTGASTPARANADGRFLVSRVPVGTVVVTARALGYAVKRVDGVVVRAGDATDVTVFMTKAALTLSGVTVVGDRNTGTVNRLLDEQRASRNILSGISREQIDKSPDSDAGQAIARVSSVTVTNNKFVSVRGLGERYTTTALNGARVPSPEPEKRDVPLDVFPSGLLEAVTTSKTFTADQAGDFSGAEVNLRTRDFPGKAKWTISSSFGINDAVSFQDVVAPQRAGGELFGQVADARGVPSVLAPIANVSPISAADQQPLLRSLRNVWTTARAPGLPEASTSLTVGGESDLLGRPLGYIASFSYSLQQEIRRNDTRVTAGESGRTPTGRLLFSIDDSLSGEQSSQAMLAGGLLNLSTRVGQGTTIRLNNSYTRSAENEATYRRGFTNGFDPVARFRRFETERMAYLQREVRSHQLTGEHLLGQRSTLSWGLSNSEVQRREPDRSDFARSVFIDTLTNVYTPGPWIGNVRSATRMFGDLAETNWEGRADYRHVLGATATGWALKVGAMWRQTDRRNRARAYDILTRIFNPTTYALPTAEQIFAPTNIAANAFRLQDNPYGGNYDASETMFAGYAQFEVPISSRVDLTAGVRVEYDTMQVATQGILGLVSQVEAGFKTLDPLPSLALKVGLSDRQTLRFGLSQTLARPNYREMSNMIYFEPIGGDLYFGNPNLRRSLIRNADVRWEFYPRAGELLSAGVFVKDFVDPIEQVIGQLSGSNSISWENVDGAFNTGLELELRKRLDVLASPLDVFTVFANASAIRSRIRLTGSVLAAAPTDTVRPMVGQAEYVLNGGLSYASRGDGRRTATVLFNRVGPRIALAGTGGLPNAINLPRNLVDVSAQLPLTRTLAVKASGKNLLDAPFEQQQAGFFRRRYRQGRVFQVGFTWATP